jgi:ribonuclease VapC
MSDTYVLDASAILTVINGEAGFATVQNLLQQSVTSAVNMSEVVAKLQEQGVTDPAIMSILNDFDMQVVAFDNEQAIAAGMLRNQTRKKGLSLGDRACLALAASRNAIAVTTDKAWKDLDNIARLLVVR